ncbi:hypothetical protein AMECASPLE_033289 [Ameca splendens]|uniref:Uncharacterized protein n=1 Tax=Ameca splendens TaxID=208324 RepID=A0ABV0YTS0_9TELE
MCVAKKLKETERQRHDMSMHLCVYVCPYVCIRCVGETAAHSLQKTSRPAGHQTNTVTTVLRGSQRKGNKKTYGAVKTVFKNQTYRTNQERAPWSLAKPHFSALSSDRSFLCR